MDYANDRLYWLDRWSVRVLGVALTQPELWPHVSNVDPAWHPGAVRRLAWYAIADAYARTRRPPDLVELARLVDSPGAVFVWTQEPKASPDSIRVATRALEQLAREAVA